MNDWKPKQTKQAKIKWWFWLLLAIFCFGISIVDVVAKGFCTLMVLSDDFFVVEWFSKLMIKPVLFEGLSFRNVLNWLEND